MVGKAEIVVARERDEGPARPRRGGVWAPSRDRQASAQGAGLEGGELLSGEGVEAIHGGEWPKLSWEVKATQAG